MPTPVSRAINEKLRDCIWGVGLLAAREHADAGEFKASLECAKAVLARPDVITEQGGRLHWQAWHVASVVNTAISRPDAALHALEKAVELWEADTEQHDPAGVAPRLLREYAEALDGLDESKISHGVEMQQ